MFNKLDKIMIAHKVVPPLLALLGCIDDDGSEKAWPQQLLLNKKGFTRRSCLASVLHTVRVNVKFNLASLWFYSNMIEDLIEYAY